MVRRVAGRVDGDERGAVGFDLFAVAKIVNRLRQRGVAEDHLRDVDPAEARPELGHAAEVIGVAVREDDP